MSDPHQKNLFDVFDKSSSAKAVENESTESDEPVVGGGIMGVEDDPLLAIVAEHILGTIEVASLEDTGPVHFDDIIDRLQPMGISVDEVDEAIAHLLQHRQIVEIEQDFFGHNTFDARDQINTRRNENQNGDAHTGNQKNSNGKNKWPRPKPQTRDFNLRSSTYLRSLSTITT